MVAGFTSSACSLPLTERLRQLRPTSAPPRKKAHVMQPLAEVAKTEEANWGFRHRASPSDINVNKNTYGSQYLQPLFEFLRRLRRLRRDLRTSRLATQLFGDRMIIANATGCSSIYGGSAPTCPYTKNEEGHGSRMGKPLFGRQCGVRLWHEPLHDPAQKRPEGRR